VLIQVCLTQCLMTDFKAAGPSTLTGVKDLTVYYMIALVFIYCRYEFYGVFPNCTYVL
jgi:hypothetical protein